MCVPHQQFGGGFMCWAPLPLLFFVIIVIVVVVGICSGGSGGHGGHGGNGVTSSGRWWWLKGRDVWHDLCQLVPLFGSNRKGDM